MGFDNAHGVPARGGRYRKPDTQHDHWHRSGNDEGRPYRFSTADQLLADFFSEVQRILADLNIDDTVHRESSRTERTPE